MRVTGLPALVLSLLVSPVMASPKIAPEVAAALDNATRVRVLVTLQATAGLSDPARVRDVSQRTDAVLSALPDGHFELRRRFQRVPALAIEIDRRALEALAGMSGIGDVEIDAGGVGSMAQSAPLAHVTDTLNAGLLGNGAKIAVVDSGIDTDHPDFSGRISAQQCFCSGPAGAVGCCPNGADTMSGAGSAEDDHSHGTNVSGILGAGGAVALRGSAPASTLVSVKVLDSNNSFCCSSDVIAAFDWILANHPDTDVVNASLGTNALFATQCDAAGGFGQAMATALNNLVQNGTMVFVSSGNQGSATSIPAPACASGAFVVGAVWDANVGSQTVLGCTETTAADKPTCFTNSNPQVALYAPGAPVTSSGLNGGQTTFFGTSQATPLTAGCAASLLAEFPAASLADVRAALIASPTRVTDPKNGLEFPRLDCAAAAAELLGDGVFYDGFED